MSVDPSRRTLFKVTYAPTQATPDDQAARAKRQRGLDKIVVATALRAGLDEVADARAATNDAAVRTALDALGTLAMPGRDLRAVWQAIAKLPATSLIGAGRLLATRRRVRRDRLRSELGQLLADHAAVLRQRAETAMKPVIATIAPPAPPAPMAAIAPGTAHVVVPGNVPARGNPWKPEPTSDPRFNPTALRSSVSAALLWVRATDPVRADTLAGDARSLLGGSVDPGRLVTVAGDGVTDTVASSDPDGDHWTDDLVDGFVQRMTVEPIGRLHLERIDMSPIGIVRGELVHSVGLAPKETVTLIHREWSSRETSFEKVVQEEFEQSTEDGVTENTELASATDTQSRHSSQLSIEASASGSYGFASASVSLGYQTSSDDETAKRDSRNHSISVTRKAASRSRKEHKSTFTVKQQAGVEDQSVRTLVNPSETDPMRIDLHQMMRKWLVELYRYGLRLTYDIVVPAPGLDLLANVVELRGIDDQLAQSFVFELVPHQVTRDNWTDLAATYGAEVPAPPAETLAFRRSLPFPYRSEEDSVAERFDVIEIELPEGYAVRHSDFAAWFTLYVYGVFDVMNDPPGATTRGANTADLVFGYTSGLENLQGRTGTISIVIVSQRVTAGYAEVTVQAANTSEAFAAWQHAAWAALRKGAEDRWQASRQELAQRRQQLSDELASWDPLTLRRMEREEIMKTTLKWLFGPAFDLMPSEIAQLYDTKGPVATLEPAQLTPGQWGQALGLGELIKYLHQAIEWENVLYFVYPYFWDNPKNHRIKLFLTHPDAEHRAFLRGGAARVVLTVRPGFEESFTQLFETGSIDQALPGDHPYVAIAQEIRDYAATHYPGIPPDSADSDAVDAAEAGIRIARWNDYTPVSALDLTINTPLADLK